MMMMSEAAKALGGELIGADTRFTAVSKDTRSIAAGDLYIAIKGDRFDGHAFIQQAGKAGAAGALVSEVEAGDIPLICVDDTRLALGGLAAYWRERFAGKLVGITGSNGKTTVKEMTRSILVKAAGEAHVLSTRGNLNNDIGMPMTLLSLREQHEYAVIEMGANHPGEIEYLSHIAQPHVALVNNAGPAHLEGFGSIENVARCKAEIYGGLVAGGTAVINADDTYADYWRGLCENLDGNQQLLQYSMQHSDADIYAEVTGGDDTNEFEITTPVGKGRISLSVPGKHNILNALAAASIAVALGLTIDHIVDGLNAFEGVSGRLAMVQGESGASIINDTYNANPRSLYEAMKVLAAQGGDTWLVLGDMGELGEAAEQLHREAGEQARELGIKQLLATGDMSRHAATGFGDASGFYEDREQLIKRLKQSLNKDSTVLVKGSRSMGMEQIVNALIADPKGREVH